MSSSANKFGTRCRQLSCLTNSDSKFVSIVGRGKAFKESEAICFSLACQFFNAKHGCRQLPQQPQIKPRRLPIVIGPLDVCFIQTNSFSLSFPSSLSLLAGWLAGWLACKFGTTCRLVSLSVICLQQERLTRTTI